MAPITEVPSCEASLKKFASIQPQAVLNHFQSSTFGLTDEEASRRLKIVGPNILTSKKPPTKLKLLVLSLHNPFNYLLLIIAIVSVSVPAPQWDTFGVIFTMVVTSCIVRYWQDLKSTVAAVRLQADLLTQVYVRRICDGHESESIAVDGKSLVPGDLLLLNPGDAVPADCFIIESLNLWLSQSGYVMLNELFSLRFKF
jgi:Mg2+-importing ATPase